MFMIELVMNDLMGAKKHRGRPLSTLALACWMNQGVQCTVVLVFTALYIIFIVLGKIAELDMKNSK